MSNSDSGRAAPPNIVSDVRPVGSLQVVSAAAASLPDRVTVMLPSDKIEAATAIAGEFSVSAVEPQVLISFGQESIGSFGARLDEILDQITKGGSPVLFELFRSIRDGVEDADLRELEQDIRARLKGNFLERILMAVGLSDPAKRLGKVTEEVRGMLQSKAKSLRDLIAPMEAQIAEESGKLIGEVSRMSSLADSYRESVVSLGVFVEAGRRIAGTAESELAKLQQDARSGDPLKVQEVRDFAQRLDLFKNRVLVLETAYVKAPADLDSIGIARGAALSTLADTVMSANAEFNDIKSVLIRLHALFQIQSVQQMNQMRRELRASLQQYGLQVLEDVSVAAARTAGETRLEDAELVLGTAQRLRSIADKVLAEGDKNRARFAEARTKLEQARQLIAADRSSAARA